MPGSVLDAGDAAENKRHDTTCLHKALFQRTHSRHSVCPHSLPLFTGVLRILFHDLRLSYIISVAISACSLSIVICYLTPNFGNGILNIHELNVYVNKGGYFFFYNIIYHF